LALEARAPGLTVRTAEPAGFDDAARSLASGRIERNAAMTGSICDAILTPAPGTLTFPILHRLCGPGLTATDDEALHAMALAFTHLRLVLEPGGAIALAAARFRERVEGAARMAAEAGEDFESLGPDAQLEWYARFRARP
jgi:threonine dehydratase